MLHYRDKRVKELSKQKMFFFLLFCFTCFFLVHLTCIGAEEIPKGTDSQKLSKKSKETNSPKSLKKLSRESLSKSVSFSSQESSDSAHSPKNSNGLKESNSLKNLSLSSYESSGSLSPTSNESSPDRDRVTNVFTNPQNKEDDLTPLPQIKKRSSLTRSLSSLISREKYPKIEQKPFSPTCKNQESRPETTTVLHKIDEKKEIAEEILSSFVDEKAVFEALIDLEGTAFEKFEGAYPPTFILSLRELTFQRFPGRVENLKLALAEYDKKTKNIPPSASIITLTTKQVADYWLLKQLLPSDLVNACMLFQYWLNNSELAYLQGLKLALNPEEGGMLNFPWSLSNAHRFASALYLRDAGTFQAINPGDILLHVIKKDHASKEAIITLIANYETTVDAWTSQIVNEKDEKNKKTLIKNFAYLERYLHKTHNYHGASQVDACLTRISHLWATNPALNPSNIDPYWTSVNEAMAHNHNHKLYREQLIRSQNEPTYLPIFMVIVHDLAFLLESSFGEEPEKVLPGLAIALEPLLKLKMITPLNHFSSLLKKETDNPFLKHACEPSQIEENS